MAINSISEPQDYQPAFNPIEFVFSSDNVAECDFAFICDVYVNGAFATRLKAFPEGQNDYGYFSVHRIIQDYLSYDFRGGKPGFYDNENSIKSYYVEIRESYNTSNDCTGASSLSSVLYTSSEKYAWNGALQYHEYPYYDQDKYVATSSGTKFLTNVPDGYKIALDKSFMINFLQLESNPVKYIDVYAYDRSGVFLYSFQYVNTFFVPADPKDLLLSVGVGPKDVNIYFGGELIDSNVGHYTIQLQDDLGNYISELRSFYVDYSCENFKRNSIWFLNRLGGFDPADFNLERFRNVDINRFQFTKFLQNDYSVGDRGGAVFAVNSGDNISLNTDWLSLESAKWIEELFTSPEVYLYMAVDKTEQIYSIIGAAHNAGNSTAYFVLDPEVILPAGTMFTYTVDDGSPIGMANSGGGTIIGYDVITGYHITDVASSINAGALITGEMAGSGPGDKLIPAVLTQSSYDEKTNKKVKNRQYTVELKPSYKINVQSL